MPLCLQWGNSRRKILINPRKAGMILSIIRRPANLTAALWQRHRPYAPPLKFPISYSFFSSDTGSNNSVATRFSELTRVPNLLEGCDYEHWLVVMDAPKGYPLRDEIVNGYVQTLAMALGSEEEAKRSIYSVSTKYYYAFGCKVPENLTYKIKSLSNVKWILPDSYLSHGENSYGGEPFINGAVVPYDEKYHADWVQDENAGKVKSIMRAKKPTRKRKKKSI